MQSEGEPDMRAPQQREVIEAMGRVRGIGAAGRGQSHPLMWQPHIEIGLELDRLRSAPAQAVAAIGAVARNALPEDLHQQVEIGELGKARTRIVEGRPKGIHDPNAAVGHRDDETIAARIDLQGRIAVERGPAMGEDIVDQLGKNSPCGAGQFLEVGPRGTASLQTRRRAGPAGTGRDGPC